MSVVVSCTAGTSPDSGMTADSAPCRGSRPCLPLSLFPLSPTASPNHCIMRRTLPAAGSYLIPPVSSLFSLPPYQASAKRVREFNLCDTKRARVCVHDMKKKMYCHMYVGIKSTQIYVHSATSKSRWLEKQLQKKKACS